LCHRKPNAPHQSPAGGSIQLNHENTSPSAAASGTFLIGGDLPVHRLGYGTMRLVGEGAWGEPADPAEARRVLRRAVELGVTLIDTADAYGPEIAERLIGEALAPIRPAWSSPPRAASRARVRPKPSTWAAPAISFNVSR
jgi:pyridoxine 4-dehydrogenase